MIRPPPLPTRWALALFDDSRRTPDAPLRQRGTMLLPLGPARPGSGLTLIYPAALEKSLAALRRFIASSSSHSRSSPRLRSSIRRRARSWERRSALSLSLWAVVPTSRSAGLRVLLARGGRGGRREAPRRFCSRSGWAVAWLAEPLLVWSGAPQGLLRMPGRRRGGRGGTRHRLGAALEPLEPQPSPPPCRHPTARPRRLKNSDDHVHPQVRGEGGEGGGGGHLGDS